MKFKVFLAVNFWVLSMLVIPNSSFSQQTAPFKSNALSQSSYSGKVNLNTNHYTGTPNISIPIFSYSQSDIYPVNVSVDYSSIGTSLNELASCVGLGWHLNATGFVKRSIVGTPDEFSFATTGSPPTNVGFLNTPAISMTPTPSRATLDDYYNSKIDGEPDVFTFSFFGYSGKIIIDKNQTVIGTIPKSDLIISFNRVSPNGRINKFTIQTDNGTVYEFSQEEVLKYKTKIDGIERTFDYTSTWFLSKIYLKTNNNTNDAIFFNYETYYSNEITGYENFHAMPVSTWTGSLGTLCFISGGSCCCTDFPYYSENIKIDGNLKRISNITFFDGTAINFTYKTNFRCDLEYDKALDLITVSNPLTNKTIKKYKFDFSYMSSSGEVAYTSCSTLDLNKRLILKSITEFGNDNTTLNPYKFEYDNSINLPARNDYHVDKWGFSSIPSAAKAYVLNKMINPNGSFTSYEYEPNTIAWTKSSSAPQTIGGIRIKRIITNEGSDPIVANNPQIEYLYSYDNLSNISSGEVDYLPIDKFSTFHDLTHISPTCVIQNNSLEHIEYDNFTMLSPIPGFPVGNTCGYSYVTQEIKSGSQSLGKTVYKFKNFADYVNEPTISGANMAFPFPNKSYNISWGLGLPKITEIYNTAGQILKKSENTFDVQSSFINSNLLTSLKVGLLWGPTNRNSSNTNGDLYQYESYIPLTGKTTLISSKNTEFFYVPGSSTPSSISSEVTNEYVQNKNLLRSTSGFDSKGNKIKTVFYYPFDYNITSSSTSFPAIGLMNSMNIISPVISQETWMTKSGINYLIAASIQDYQILSNGLIKPSKSFSLQSSEPIPEISVPTIISGSIFRNPSLFKEINSIESYSPNGSITQITNDKYLTTSILYGYNNSQVVATVINARLNEIAYTSFEKDDVAGNHFTWNFNGGNGSIVTGSGMPTGDRCASGFNSISTNIPINQEYKLSFWATTNNYALNAPITPSLVGATINGWTYYEYDLPINSISPRIEGTGMIDEIRLYPKKANMFTTTYEVGVGKTSECDINNHISYYEYDGFNRITKVFDERHNIIKTYEYHFKN